MADPDPVPAADSAEMYRVDNSELEAKFGDGSGSTLFTCLHTRFFLFWPGNHPGLPDGLFSNQKSYSGKNFQVLRSENLYIFYGHLEYWMDIWDIL
jgi:hypothetical protein